MGLHYQIAGSYRPAVHLIGSETAKIGLELFGDGIVHEQVSDFVKQKREKSLPFWVIPDTKGKLKGKLHALRRFEFCRDVIMLVSEATPREYIDYLKERQYDYFVIGKEQVDLRQALEFAYVRFGAKRVLTDTGRVLSNLLKNIFSNLCKSTPYYGIEHNAVYRMLISGFVLQLVIL